MVMIEMGYIEGGLFLYPGVDYNKICLLLISQVTYLFCVVFCPCVSFYNKRTKTIDHFPGSFRL